MNEFCEKKQDSEVMKTQRPHSSIAAAKNLPLMKLMNAD
jgi:hypothetical protein